MNVNDKVKYCNNKDGEICNKPDSDYCNCTKKGLKKYKKRKNDSNKQ